MSKNTAKDTRPTNYELLSAIHGFADYVQSNMVTKDDFFELKQKVDNHETILNNYQTILENIATNVNKIQEDHIAAIEWLKRHDQKLETHDVEIKHIKFQLNGI